MTKKQAKTTNPQDEQPQSNVIALPDIPVVDPDRAYYSERIVLGAAFAPLCPYEVYGLTFPEPEAFQWPEHQELVKVIETTESCLIPD